MLVTYLFHLLGLVAFSIANPKSLPTCKAIPGSPSWPGIFEWNRLNRTLHGRLIAPSPPGAVCHPTRPEFNIFTCPAVQVGWLTTAWHADNPVSSPENNWNNDTCLPIPMLPCTGEGYPVYVINATCALDVKRGVDFARKKGVRLVVKGTGHDYLGRSTAPKSLSIWTHHMRGITFQDGFKPKGCSFTIAGPAFTAAAGTQMIELNEQAHLRNLMVMSGGAGTVGVGGYLTGGGHSALSSTYGLAVDQVLEMEIVTPQGEILTVNECQHMDLFWAMRGGGGSTFGIMTSVTIRAFPAVPIFTVTAIIGTFPNSPVYWDVIPVILSAFPSLDAQGISGYTEIAPSFKSAALNITTPLDGFLGIFILPALSPANTSESLIAAITTAIDTALAPFPGQFFVEITPSTYADFWAYYQVTNGPLDGGHDQILGSRLVDGQALTGNRTALKEAYRTATPPGEVTSAYLVGGHGVMNAKPRGGGNAVNPAWRKAFVHSVLGVSWAPLDNADRVRKEAYLDSVLVEGLRKLTPGMGAYVNEAYPYEKDWQHVFWGSNYERLSAIKKKVDPEDVLWCHPCVGNEGWHVVDDILCRI